MTIRYSRSGHHDLYLGTCLGRDAGRIQVTINDGAPVAHDLYLNDYNGLAAMRTLAGALPAGTHTVEIRALSINIRRDPVTTSTSTTSAP